MGNRFDNRIEAIARQVYARLLSSTMPFYTVNEYPKSGGTWVGHMLSVALSVPFPRHCMPNFESSILHGHHLYPFGMKNVLCVWRDGRDVIVSWYYHCLFRNELHNSRLVEIVRNDLPFEDYDDVVNNLPHFIKYVYGEQKHPSFSWSDFVRKWSSRKDVVHVRYEDLRANTADELQRIVYELSNTPISKDLASEIAEAFSFAKMSGRKSGEEVKNSFMRKGVVGDWKNTFSSESRQLFDVLAGNELITLGYESNHDWVTNDS